jgi:hypothetical protein
MTYFDPATEYVRPWKIFSLLCGIAFLLLGARYSRLPDWDVTVSFIMAVPAYFTAPCSLRVFLERRWKQFPLALFWSWFTIDGTYTAYWYLVDPGALVLRPANALASSALYGVCGLVWLQRGSLRQLAEKAAALSKSMSLKR